MGAADNLYRVSSEATGRSLRRAITASVLAKIQRSTASIVLKRNWPRDDHAIEIIKAAQNPTATTNFPTHDQIGSFRSLAPGSAALRLFDLSVKLDLAGVSTIRIPNVKSQIRAPFVAEGSPGPVAQLSSSATVLGPARKVLILSALTKELENASAESASAVIGKVLADASNASIDMTAFDAVAGDDVRPAGLLHNVTPLTASPAGPDAMVGDLANLAAAIGAAGIDPSGIVYVAGVREATIIQLKAGPKFENEVIPTLGLPAGTVAAFAPSGTFSGYRDAPLVETSDNVSLHYEDTAPLPIVDGGTPAAPTRSAFQQDVVVVRVKAWASWACAPGAAQIVNSVEW